MARPPASSTGSPGPGGPSPTGWARTSGNAAHRADRTGRRGAGDLQVAVSIRGRPNTPLHDDDRAAALARRPTWLLCGFSVLDCVMSHHPGVSRSLAVISLPISWPTRSSSGIFEVPSWISQSRMLSAPLLAARCDSPKINGPRPSRAVDLRAERPIMTPLQSRRGGEFVVWAEVAGDVAVDQR